MCSTWRNPIGIENRAESRGPSTSCVNRISLMEVCSVCSQLPKRHGYGLAYLRGSSGRKKYCLERVAPTRSRISCPGTSDWIQLPSCPSGADLSVNAGRLGLHSTNAADFVETASGFLLVSSSKMPRVTPDSKEDFLPEASPIKPSDYSP